MEAAGAMVMATATDPFEAEDMIRQRVIRLCETFNRKYTEALITVFTDTLKRFPVWAIAKAFSNVEQSAERFPTPKRLSEEAGEIAGRKEWSDVLVRTETDEHGEAVYVYQTDAKGKLERRYRMEGCDEGRAFQSWLRDQGRGRGVREGGA